MWKVSSILILIVLCLLAFGIVMVASTSSIKSAAIYEDPLFFLKHQILWLSIALLTGYIFTKLDYHRLRQFAAAAFIGAIILLALVLVPGLGTKVGGSQRWFRLGPLSIQVSEPAKFALILMLAWWMTREQRHAYDFFRGACIPVALISCIALLIFFEPDFGTSLLVLTVGMLILFAAGTRFLYLAFFTFLGLSAFTFAIFHDTVRMHRILAFLEPAKYARTYSFQLINAINAFIAGGAWGVGLGESTQKHFYLPEAHTDFIFAIIGEELGVVASVLIILLFLAFFLCGLRISLKAHDLFGRLLAFGITMMISLQAMVNIAIVTGCLPTKGLPLPFISFGGSSMVMSLLEVGVLINIGLHETDMPGTQDSQIAKRSLYYIPSG